MPRHSTYSVMLFSPPRDCQIGLADRGVQSPVGGLQGNLAPSMTRSLQESKVASRPYNPPPPEKNAWGAIFRARLATRRTFLSLAGRRLPAFGTNQGAPGPLHSQMNTASRVSRYVETEKLLERAHAGDREALGALLEMYRRHMSLLARSQIDPLLRVKVDASDLAQDACLEAHRHFGQFRGTTEAEFGAWMRKILAGLLANSIRRYKGTQQRDVRRERPVADAVQASSLVAANEPIARDGTPSEQVQRRETSAQLAEAVDQLAPHYRQVIDLRNLEGLSFVEVSQQMGRSVDSVEKLWTRAVGKLRRVLQPSKG